MPFRSASVLENKASAYAVELANPEGIFMFSNVTRSFVSPASSCRCLFMLALFFMASTTTAQVYVFSGIHENYVRNKVLANESPLTSWHIGGGVRFVLSEDKPKTIFNVDYAFVRKGYKQMLGGEESYFHFNYLTYQGTVGYQLLPWMTVKGGFNLAILINANLKWWYKTYRMVDFGLVGGIDFLERKRVSIYTRVVYGLVPMVKYYDIDPIGNFNGTIYDLKNTCVMVGFKVRLNEKEFHLRH